MNWRLSNKFFSLVILLVLVLAALPIASAQQVGAPTRSSH